MARYRTSCALLLLLAAAAFNGCWASWNADDFDIIFGQGGNGGNGGNVVQLSETNQVGINNAAKTLQKATANGGNGGDGVVGRRLLAGEDGFPDSFIVVGKGGNGGNGGRVYQRSSTNQVGINNEASTTQEASANGGNGGDGVNGRKLLKGEFEFPKFLYLVGKGGNGGNGGNVVQYSVTNQVGINNTASTTQTASANGGNGGNGIKSRKLLDDTIFVFGKGGNGGKGGYIGQFSATNQVGFNNKASTKQKASANGGNGGDGVRG